MNARTAGAAVFVGLLVLAVASSLTGGGEPPPPPSVESRRAEGRRAAFRFLEELGFEVRAWREPPGRLLETEPALLWLSAVPGKGSERAALGRLVDPFARRRFVEDGGVLVVAAADGIEAFLTRDLDLASFRDRFAPASDGPIERRPRDVIGPGGDRLVVPWRSDDPFRESGLAVGAPVRGLVDASGVALSLELDVGRGRVVVLADDGFLANERLREGDSALLLARLARDLAREKPVLFDEFALGEWRPPSAVALLASPRLALVPLHVIVLLALVAWRLAFAGPFPRDPAPLDRVSPLARARVAWSLHSRARRHDVLGRWLVRGAALDLARRFGLARRGEEAPDVRELIGRLAELAGLDPSRVQAELLESTVSDERDLERLAERLGDLERRLSAESSAARPLG